MGRMESRFHRDLRLLIVIGAIAAVAILAAGLAGLRGAAWEGSGVAREMAIYAAAGAGVLGLAGVWVWSVARRVRRGREGRR